MRFGRRGESKWLNQKFNSSVTRRLVQLVRSQTTEFHIVVCLRWSVWRAFQTCVTSYIELMAHTFLWQQLVCHLPVKKQADTYTGHSVIGWKSIMQLPILDIFSGLSVRWNQTSPELVGKNNSDFLHRYYFVKVGTAQVCLIRWEMSSFQLAALVSGFWYFSQ